MLVGIFISTPLFFLALLARGHVLAILWQWFLVPIGLPPVSVPLALGIAVTLGIVTGDPFAAKDKDFADMDQWQKSLASILISYATLAFGWGFTQFM